MTANFVRVDHRPRPPKFGLPADCVVHANWFDCAHCAKLWAEMLTKRHAGQVEIVEYEVPA